MPAMERITGTAKCNYWMPEEGFWSKNQKPDFNDFGKKCNMLHFEGGL